MLDFKRVSGTHKWIALFALWAVHGVVELRQYLSLSGGAAAFFQLSALRVSIGLLLAFWVFVNIALIVAASGNFPPWPAWNNVFTRSKTRNYVFISALVTFFAGICIRVLYGLFAAFPPSMYDNYLRIILPLLNLMTYVSFELVVLVFLAEFLKKEERPKMPQEFLAKIGIILVVLAVSAAFIASTGLGIVPSYKGDWSRGLPAVPLLEWQIAIACMALAGTAFLETRKKRIGLPYLELSICAVIWIFSSALWLSQPIIPNASALKPHGPNFEIYPFLDAQTYDQFAQSILIGNGFGENRIPQRPLYIVFLVFAHLLMGQDYEGVIFLQTLFFAFFPVLLYLFGREFFGRPIGIAIALLAILRDYTSNLVSPFTGNLSYSKVYLAEIPTAMLLALFLFMGMRWIRSGFSTWLGFVLGGILGCAMLIRTQVVVALPVLMLFALLTKPKTVRPLVKSAVLMIVAVSIVVSPWLWRNWRLTGSLIFDSPESQMINLALRYSRINGFEPDVMPLPGESNTAYNQRLNQISSDAISSNPYGALWGVANSFLNHGVNNILLFPLRTELQGLGDLWVPSYAFWERWEGKPGSSQISLLVFYTFLFGLGVATAWHRNGWMGLLPLGVNLAYNLWTSLALLSGQRFMLTMDWSVYLYYLIGLYSVFVGFLSTLEGGCSLTTDWLKNKSLVHPVSPAKNNFRQYFFAGLLFLGIGVLPPASERIFPVKYPPLPQNELLTGLLTSPGLEQSGFHSTCLQDLAVDGAIRFVQGRTLYPRYYMAGDGERITDAIGYKVAAEDRLVFEIIGQKNDRVIFQARDHPDFFPHASDAILIYGEGGELLFIFVQQGNDRGFYISRYFDAAMCR